MSTKGRILDMVTEYAQVDSLSILASLMLVFALCSPFAPLGANDSFFRLSPLSIGIGTVCIMSFLCTLRLRTKTFYFTYLDALIVLPVAYCLLRYDYSLHLADWKIIYAFLLLFLWFIARFIISCCPDARKIFPVFISALGGLLSIWGMMQLYGLVDSGHSMFRITGPFFNPGPYAGYLALLLSVSFHGFLIGRKGIKYFHALSIVLMLSVLPSTMSRSAWIAVIVSLLWVVMMQKGWLQKFVEYSKKRPYKVIGWGTIVCAVMAFAAVSMFHLKADSAYGRLLIWKNTCQAISKKPLTGYGIGQFPAVYGKVQADYFASGQATEIEKYVAGYVEYAFNDYLQIALEGGILLLALALISGILVFCQGIVQKEYGLCGGLLAFALFAFFSYPLQLLPFGIVLVVFGSFCVIPTRCRYKKRACRFASILSLLLCIATWLVVWKLSDLPWKYREWKVADMLLHQSLYDVAANGYQDLYPYLKGNSIFLHNYAIALHGNGNTTEACRILEYEKRLSNDSSIWNLQGVYYQTLGDYHRAEQCFKYSLCLAPLRMYPYYLLTKLYCEKNFFNKSMALEMAEKVLTFSPKVNSDAIVQMRKEIYSLYKQLKLNH